jgi:isoleucyl-tRNA synthetase
LHRENIDDIEIPSSKNDGSTLKRVKVVFDCWFESGSMPYAQQHYPFENKAKLENGFPADFIAEGLDQTRGWFYTLMVLSTALFNKPAFKNLIVNGLVLAADGKKMSKRLKNYPAPTIVVDECGADALRMYLVNSPVVRAQELKFQRAGVKAVVRDMLQPWYSALRMLTQNIKRLNAESGNESNFQVSCEMASKATNVFDIWVNGKLQKLVQAVHTEVGAYRLYSVLPNLVTFINDLNNWYIRLNRPRFKGSGGVDDCKFALSSLYKVLLIMCKILAPFTPFFTEFVFQHLKKIGNSDDFVNSDVNQEAVQEHSIDPSASVHFFPMPLAEENVDDDVLLQVSYLQKIIESGRLARARAGERKDQRLRNGKCPIKEIVIVHGEKVARDAISKVTKYIATELNCKKIQITGDELEWCTFAAIPNMKAIGKRFGPKRDIIIAGLGLADPNAGKKKKKKKKKKNDGDGETKEEAPPAPKVEAPKGLPHAQMQQFETTGEMTINHHVLTKAEVDVKRVPKMIDNFQGIIVDSGRHADTRLVVFVSMVVDDSSVKDMIVREISSSVNRLRKAADLVSADRIRVFYDVDETSKNSNAKKLVEEAMKEQLSTVEAKLSAPVASYSERQDHMIPLAEDKMDIFGYKINVCISKKSISFPKDNSVLSKLFTVKPEIQSSALKDYVGMIPYNEIDFEKNLTVEIDGESATLVPGTHFFEAPSY